MKYRHLFAVALVLTVFEIQSSFANDSLTDKADRGIVDTKKEGRSLTRKAKKAGRDLTGEESKWSDFKDEAKDSIKDTKDEAKLAKRKLNRKLNK